MKKHQLFKSLFFLVLVFITLSSNAQITSNQWSGLVGFANYNDMRNGITGGYGGEVVRVSNREDFTRYVGDNTPRVVILEGRLEGTGINRKKDIISVGSNKTIIGAGSGATLYGIGLDINTKENIIIRNLIIF